jgi:RNA polymerase sigma-70 factor (ECF subfamily)
MDRLRHGSGDSFRGWLRTITRNRITDLNRANQKRPVAAGGTEANERLHHQPQADSSLDNVSSAQERAELLSRALQMVKGDFEEATWQAFWQSAVEGTATAEIAEKLDMKPNAVRQARYRVTRRLREEFGHLLD